MRKKDARILFNVDDARIITDFLVEEFTPQNNPQHLYDFYKKDIGNCLHNWEDWTLALILKKFLIEYGISQSEKYGFIANLCKVDEWRKELGMD